MATQIGREILYKGKGIVFINDIPFAYAKSAEVSQSFDKVTATRSHERIPDRVEYTKGELKLTLSLQSTITQKDFLLFFTAEEDIDKPLFFSETVHASFDSGGEYSHSFDSTWVPVKIMAVDDEFRVYELVSGTDWDNPAAGALHFTVSDFANKTVRLYITYRVTGTKIRMSGLAEPKSVSIRIENQLSPEGKEVLYVPKAKLESRSLPRNFEEAFGDFSLEFAIEGEYEVWYV